MEFPQDPSQAEELMNEVYEKLPESVRSQVDLDKLNVAEVRTRGSSGAVDELQMKLERFKVKTVQQLGGVVKEEENKRP